MATFCVSFLSFLNSFMLCCLKRWPEPMMNFAYSSSTPQRFEPDSVLFFSLLNSFIYLDWREELSQCTQGQLHISLSGVQYFLLILEFIYFRSFGKRDWAYVNSLQGRLNISLSGIRTCDHLHASLKLDYYTMGADGLSVYLNVTRIYDIFSCLCVPMCIRTHSICVYRRKLWPTLFSPNMRTLWLTFFF